MIRIITIERQYGCGGARIASLLAERLGWKIWDQLLTEEIARLAQCKLAVIEQLLYRRLLRSFALGSYEGSGGVYPVEELDAEAS